LFIESSVNVLCPSASIGLLNLYTAFFPDAIHVDHVSLFITQRTACSVAGFTIPVNSSRNNTELSVAACLIG